MDNFYNTITRKQLISILNTMSPALIDNGHSQLFEFWKDYVETFANDSVYFNKEVVADEYYSIFKYDYSFADVSSTLYFDTCNINKNLLNGTLTTTLESFESYNELLNELLIFPVALCTGTIKSNNPVAVYLPSFIYTKNVHFAIVDGNESLRHYHDNNNVFDGNIILPSTLRIDCFKNLNSFIVYQLIASYCFANALSKNDFDKYFDELKVTLKSANTIISKYN